MLVDIALVMGAYLVGSLPYMTLLARTRGVDLSHEKDLHIALWNKVGHLEGLSGVIFDVLKGVISVIIGFIFDFTLVVIASAGVAVTIGQIWPVFRRFNGEKGNTTGLGVIASLTIAYHAYLVLLIFLIPMLAGIGIKIVTCLMVHGKTLRERLKLIGPDGRSMPLVMFISFSIAPLASWGLRQPMEITLCLGAIFVIIVVRRLTAGLHADLRTATNIRKILVNRIFYD